MLAIAQHRPATIGYTFESDGVDTDPVPDTASVSLYSPAGELLVDEATADDVGDGTFVCSLTAANLAGLGVYRTVWTAAFDGVEQSFTDYIEVVGGFYFSIGEFKASYADDDEVQNLSAEQIADARATAEEIIEGIEAERGCHQAFVVRSERFELSGDGTTRLAIPRYNLRSVESCSVGGASIDVDGISIEASSLYRAIWTRGFGNVTVTVTHGLDAPPRRIKKAAILLAYHIAIKGPIDDRATAVAVEGGTISMSRPDRGEAVTGIPEVDGAIGQYTLPRITPVSVSLGERGRAFPPLPVL